MRLVLIGYGRMGRLVEQFSEPYGFEVVDRLDISDNENGKGISAERLTDIDVAIDFSTGQAVIQNLPKLAALGINLVIGTTDWHAHEVNLRQIVTDSSIGVVVAPNFSLGVNIFQAIVEHSARLLQQNKNYGAWLHEIHHINKLDAPSGTALGLVSTMKHAGYRQPIDVASSRVGSTPGIHTVGFDGPSESITLTHTTRDRATFAHGALEAARWVHGKRGWFTMRDVLNLSEF